MPVNDSMRHGLRAAELRRARLHRRRSDTVRRQAQDRQIMAHAARRHRGGCGSFTLDDIHCVKGDVLYAALEDNKRRLQRRLRKLLNGRPAPERLRVLSAGEMPRLNEGGTAMIRAWIEQVPEPKLVVVDVLAKVRDPRRKDQGLYDSDYAAMEELKKIADEYGIAIVVIHHLRKMDADDPLDQVSGTTGLSGSADTVLVLNRIKRRHHPARPRPRHRGYREGGPVRRGNLHVDGARRRRQRPIHGRAGGHSCCAAGCGRADVVGGRRGDGRAEDRERTQDADEARPGRRRQTGCPRSVRTRSGVTSGTSGRT